MLKENLKDVEKVSGNELEIRIRLVSSSKNGKTGNISQTYTTANTCPCCCPFKGKCYPEYGPCKIHWQDTEKPEIGVLPENFADELENNPHTRVVRHNIAGDIATPGTSDIDVPLLNTLVGAYKRAGVTAYTYTHCEINKRNLDLVRLAGWNNFVINFSCENMEQIKECIDNGVNAIITVSEMDKKAILKDGIVLRHCPNEAGELDRHGDLMTCKECGMCWRKNRKFAIVFSLHGTKGAINKIKKDGFLMSMNNEQIVV